MNLIPKYAITPEILELISKIEVLKLHLLSLNPPEQIKIKFKRASLLKSSLFSARIEGNPLELHNLETGEDEKKQEVFNILDAIRLIESSKVDDISKDFLLKLHKIVLKDLSTDAGHFREEPSGIFNAAGVAVYISPSPKKIHGFLDKLLDYINSDSEKFLLVKAFIAHLAFEKIHPFLDGNGRVGRLLIGAILRIDKWDFSFSIPFEEYLDNHKDEYYYHLNQGDEETNAYLIFMLGAFLKELEELKGQIEAELTQKEPFLPPRQNEIYNLIKDHDIMSFDTIHRRFQKVPERTLRYDLNKLVEKSLVEKTGETRGRYYRVKKL